MGPGARWGSISNQAPSQRDGAWLVGRCHLISDLQGSGDYPQSPEQGEWMSLLQTFPITNRPPRHRSIFYVVLTLWNMLSAALCCRRLCGPGSCLRAV
jgi:hypothetical protein